MAGGWSRDGAVQDQINASIEDAIGRVRSQLAQGAGFLICSDCGGPISEARRKAIPGVRFCIECQSALEKLEAHFQALKGRSE